MKWKRYRYHVPQSLPLCDPDRCSHEAPPDGDYRQAGFDPADPEVAVACLTEDWDGHPAGSLVLTGLTCEGHPFAVRVED